MRDKKALLLAKSAKNTPKIANAFQNVRVTSSTSVTQSSLLLPTPVSSQSPSNRPAFSPDTISIPAVPAQCSSDITESVVAEPMDIECDRSNENTSTTSAVDTQQQNIQISVSVDTRKPNDMELDDSIVFESHDDAHAVDCFSRPSKSNLEAFIQMHPKQTCLVTDSVVSKAFTRKDGSKRMWLSFDPRGHNFYCWICLAFCPNDSTRSQTD